VSHAFPFVSIVIPTRPEQREVAAVASGRQLDYPREKLEIIVARGRQPAIQRNTAIQGARGELIYFLDDDSVPERNNLQRAIGHFQDPAVAMVGGPNLCPPDAPRLEQLFSVVLSSWLAFGPSRARYEAIGPVRQTNEKELISCNLVARRASLLALGGFDESLYPNEENALMDELKASGGKLLYDPELIVHRHPRPTLKAFSKMLLTYGRGRAEQFRLHPTSGSALNLVPPLFCVYLVVWPALGRLGLVPIGFYGTAILLQTIVSSFKHGLTKSLLASPLIILTHVFYGLGFWRGLFTRLQKRGPTTSADVALEIISC
jgi:succinoglycan biosynthesis protein ExoA